MDSAVFIDRCRKLLEAYRQGLLGQTVMPEDTNPGLESMNREDRLAYFTLPMSLNYQRNSYALWEAALKTFKDPETRFVFQVSPAASRPEDDLRQALTKHKLALQPNKHTNTWRTIAATIHHEWGNIEQFISSVGHDFLRLRAVVQNEHKKGFPYLSGPKLFHYWSFILGAYGGISLKNRDQIEIAPDTHVTQCSVRLGVIDPGETDTLSKEEVSKRWRTLLAGSGIDPIEMHPPLWFWSRNGFVYSLI